MESLGVSSSWACVRHGLKCSDHLNCLLCRHCSVQSWTKIAMEIFIISLFSVSRFHILWDALHAKPMFWGCRYRVMRYVLAKAWLDFMGQALLLLLILWLKYGSSTAQVQWPQLLRMAQLWLKYGSSTVWVKYGSSMAQVWLKYGSSTRACCPMIPWVYCAGRLATIDQLSLTT